MKPQTIMQPILAVTMHATITTNDAFFPSYISAGAALLL
jgi:hypothetical protein